VTLPPLGYYLLRSYYLSFPRVTLTTLINKDTIDSVLYIFESTMDVIYQVMLIAASNGHEEEIEYLVLMDQVDINYLDENGHPALYLAVDRGYDGVVSHLL
jgi:hypothetical protein